MKPTDGSKPHIIIMVGISGSGKSFFAEQFARTFKSPIISFDQLRHKLFDKPIYSDHENKVVSQAANYMLDELFKTGKTITYEGPSNQRNERTEIAKIARTAGYNPLFIWVQTEPATAKRRSIKPTDGRKPMTNDQFESKLKQFSPPHSSEGAIVISGKHTYSTQMKIILKNIATPNPNPAITTERPTRTNNILVR